MANTTASASGTEQVAGHAAQAEHRHEHDADAQRGDQSRAPRSAPRRPGWRRHVLALLQMAVDVLDRHRGVVHQDAHGQRQAAQGHDVDRLAQQRQQRHRGQDRQRDGDGDDQRVRQLPRNSRIISAVRPAAITPPGSRRDRRRHEDRLVAERLDAQLRRQRRSICGSMARTPSMMSSVEASRISGRSSARRAGRPGARCWSAARSRRARGHVAHVDDRAVDRLDRQVVRGRRLRVARRSAHVVFELPIFSVPDGSHQVLRRQRRPPRPAATAPSPAARWFEVDLHLADLAAIGRRHRRARHGRQLRPDEVQAESFSCSLRQVLLDRRELQDRHAGGAVAQDLRRRDARRAAASARSARRPSPAPVAVLMLTPGWKKTLTTP